MIPLAAPFSKQKISGVMLVMIAVFLTGCVLRFVYVWEVGHHPFLNLALPKTDLFTHDLMAKNAIHPKPFEMSASVYPITINYIALIYRLFGTGSFPVYLINFLLSMAGAGLLVLTGKNIFNWCSGILAGLGMIFYRMNFFYDGLKDGTALSQFLLIATLFCFVMFIRKGEKRFYIWFLVFALLSCSIRIFYWLMIIPAIIFCFIRFRQWRQPFLIALNIFFVVVALWSFFYFRGADGFRHKFAVHFYIGNHAKSIGLLQDIPGIPSSAEGFAKGTILKAYAESGSADHIDRYWIKKTFESYRHGYGEWLSLIGKKLSYLTNNFEPHNLSSIYYYEKYTRLKYFPRFNFAVIFSLAMAGIFLVFVKRHKAGMALFLPVVFLMAMILSIFICSRYRMPLIPFFCLYAGFGVDQLLCFVHQKKYFWMAGIVLVLIAAVIWAKLPIRFFSAERDIVFWEKDSERARQYYGVVDRLRREYKEWATMDYTKKIFLTIQMEMFSMPHEFLEAFDKIFPLTGNDSESRNALLRQRAQFEESHFNFYKALVIWQQLENDPVSQPLARQKIQELKIIGPLLDKNFLR